MSVIDPREDFVEETPETEIVHWMEPRPLAASPLGASGAVLGAFALGALTMLAVGALLMRFRD